MNSRIKTAMVMIIFLQISYTYGQNLQYPLNGSVINENQVFLSWDSDEIKSPNKIYNLYISQSANDKNAKNITSKEQIVIENITITTYQVDLSKYNFSRQKNIYWQVKTFLVDSANKRSINPVMESPVGEFSLNSLVLTKSLRVTETIDSLSFTPLPFNNDCNNGNFENGNFTSWNGYYGSRLNSATIYLNSMSSGFIPGRLSVMNSAMGNDPLLSTVGVNLPVVNQGNYSVKIGNLNANGEADLIKYTFTVTANNKNFGFRYATVLEDNGHPADQQPFFGFFIKKGASLLFNSTTERILATQQIVADANNPFFRVANVSGYSRIVYREWTPYCLDLSSYIGQTISVVFYTADCNQGGHFGYAYIDALCENNDPYPSISGPSEICLNQDLILNGQASFNETSHFWSITESDANWNVVPNTEVSNWFVGQQAGIKNLTQFYASFGKKFKCNTYYRIKLAVSNDCVGWKEFVKLIFIRCPVVDAGPDICVPCGNPVTQNYQIGGGSSATGTNYSWSPATGLSNPNTLNPFYTGTNAPLPITYTVTATDAYGCKNQDQVTLYCTKPKVELIQSIYCCGATLTAIGQDYQSIYWSNGETGVTSINITTGGSYAVIVTNPCGYVSKTITMPNIPLVNGFPNPIAYNSKFNGYSEYLYIKDVVTNSGIQGTPNSYNVTEYKIDIYDRWGHVINTLTGSSCTGFNNWDIKWDATDRWGGKVPQGTYSFKLYFKNCEYKNWVTPLERKFKDVCIEYAYLFGIRLWCKRKQLQIVDEPFGAGSVTVYY